MGYKIYRAYGLLIGAIHLLLYKFLYGRFFRFDLKSKIDGSFRLAIRNEGEVNFKKIKSRKWLSIFCDGGTITLSEGVFFNNSCSINCMESIFVGEGTIFGESVKIYDHNHKISLAGKFSSTEFSTAPVKIGKDCWIGSNCIILSGVSICDDVIIGAGSVISKSINLPGVYLFKKTVERIR